MGRPAVMLVVYGALFVALCFPVTARAACPFKQMGLAPAPHLIKSAGAPRAAEPFDPAAVEDLDWEAVKADLRKLLTTSQPEWPADFADSPTGGIYSGLFIRQAWHCAGSYRSWDGRGGCEGQRQRFYPEESWPDNTNLDKSRALLAPIKEKYGRGLSWGDLTILAGNVAIEITGGPILGFCAGRVDDADGTASLPLGPTPEQEAIAPCTAGDGDCAQPLGQTTMGLIYVNPHGVLGDPVPPKSVPHIRGTFGRMGMNDSETVALIGGGHTLGKTHGACPTGAGPSPAEDPEHPWPGTCGEGPDKGKGPNTFTSGFEGPWTTTPYTWGNQYFKNLLSYEWDKAKSPGDAWQWVPVAHKPGTAAAARGDPLPKIMMLTTDIALLHDASYLSLVQRFAEDAEAFDTAFKYAWYKLTTRDQGPPARCLGSDVPPPQPFQHPLPPPPAPEDLPDFDKVRADLLAALSAAAAAAKIAPDAVGSGRVSYGPLFTTLAWQCASSFRQTDYAGGCNGARIRLPPLAGFDVNKGMDQVIALLEPLKAKYGAGLTYADLIVLAGTAAAEAAAGAPPGSWGFCPGRSDAAEASGLEYLAPRDYVNATVAVWDGWAVLGVSPAEGVALAGRPRSGQYMQLQGYSGGWAGEGTEAEAANGYFKVLLGEEWVAQKSPAGKAEFKASGKEIYMTPEDLAIRGDEDLAPIARRYADDEAAFVAALGAAWTKVMNADRIDGPASNACDTRPAPSVAAS